MTASEPLEIYCRSRSDALRAAEHISQIEIDENEPWSIVAKPHKTVRSERQNAYLWGWLYLNIAKQLADAGITIPQPDGREIPYDKDLLHEIFKEKYLCYGEVSFTHPKTGEVLTRKQCYSTTKLIKSSKSPDDEARVFATYVNNIKAFCYGFWGITIPPTNNEELLELDREVQEAACRARP